MTTVILFLGAAAILTGIVIWRIRAAQSVPEGKIETYCCHICNERDCDCEKIEDS